MSIIWKLFFSMMKVGAFTFGGGYAMIGLLENEFVVRRSWITHDEFLDLVAIAESTPGPIAINCATYIGYLKGKLLGALLATAGMVLPSFVGLYLISLFFNSFLAIPWVESAFRGIQVCVVCLILSAGLKMLKKIKKTVFTVCFMSATFFCMVLFSLLSVSFSSFLYILIGGLVGLLLHTVHMAKKRQRRESEAQK